jgi:hypothetical protein
LLAIKPASGRRSSIAPSWRLTSHCPILRSTYLIANHQL